MEFEYVSPNNTWAIYRQGGIGSDFYSLYLYSDKNGWEPYRQMGLSIKECFLWLNNKGIISQDEMKGQISLLTDIN
jgi:hypothetical protein